MMCTCVLVWRSGLRCPSWWFSGSIWQEMRAMQCKWGGSFFLRYCCLRHRYRTTFAVLVYGYRVFANSCNRERSPCLWETCFVRCWCHSIRRFPFIWSQQKFFWYTSAPDENVLHFLRSHHILARIDSLFMLIMFQSVHIRQRRAKAVLPVKLFVLLYDMCLTRWRDRYQMFLAQKVARHDKTR